MTSTSADQTPSESLVRIQYYYATKSDESEPVDIQWLNTTTCLELAKKYATEEELKDLQSSQKF